MISAVIKFGKGLKVELPSLLGFSDLLLKHYFFHNGTLHLPFIIDKIHFIVGKTISLPG